MKLKIKTLITLIALTCLSLLYPALSPPVGAATIALLEPAAGEVGQIVKLTGSITCGGNYQIYWGSVTEGNLLTQGKATACAYVIAQFKVPETYKGRHRVILVDVTSGDEASYDFTVIPAITAATKTGNVATSVTIFGTGFEANEADIKITYDGAVVKSGITSNIKGSWSSNISIPESSKGEHSIQASGALTIAREVGYIPFTVTPRISLEPNSGGAGLTVNVTGTGFAPGERDIKLTFNGEPVRTGINANSLGTFHTTFTIPKVGKKNHVVDAFGSDTKANEVPDVTFTVGTAITLKPAAGYVGDQVTVFGSGFASGEAEIKVIYDDTPLVRGIRADAQGNWTTTFVVPPSSAGSHRVTASGTITESTEVTNQSFTVLPRLALSPTSGEVGTKIVVTGSGFGSNEAVAIMYDNIKLSLDVATDIKGNFTADFTAPASPGERHQVSVIDNAGNRAAAIYFTETTPPPTPSPLFPPPETRIGFVGRQVVSFQWSEVTDPSGVGYILEISKDADFKSPVLRHRDLIKTTYTLTKAEALDYGNYYWRVKAVDGAGNESDWTEAQPVSVSRLKVSTFRITMVTGVVAGALIILWRFRPITKKEAKKGNGES